MTFTAPALPAIETLIEAVPLSPAAAVPEESIETTAVLVLCHVTPVEISPTVPSDHLPRTLNREVPPGGIESGPRISTVVRKGTLGDAGRVGDLSEPQFAAPIPATASAAIVNGRG
jgi:hypothetical protein